MNRMQKVARNIWIGTLFILFLCAIPARAQQQDPPPQGQQPKAAGANSPIAPNDNGTTDDQPLPPTLTPGIPLDNQIRVLGTPAPYTGFDTPLHWGPFSVAGAQLIGVEDWYNPGEGQPTSQFGLGMFRTDLDFSVMIHHSPLVLQYSPQAVIQGGQISASASSNNNLGVGFNFDITPRLSILIKDGFILNQTKQVFSDQILQIYAGQGGILPGDFLQNNGTYLGNTFSVVVTYKLSPRWTLTDVPLVQYLNIKNTSINYKADGLDFRDALALTYALSPKSNIGIGYNFEEDHTLNPLVTDSYFHGITGFYSRQISQSLWAQANGGAQVAFYGGGATPPVFFTGGFSLLKAVKKASFALNFEREKALENYFTTLLDNRFDSALTLPVTGRLIWTSGVGYYDEIGTPPHTQGKYAQTTATYHLTKTLSSFANYTFRFQHSPNLQLLTGTHNTVIFGIEWAPAALPPVPIR
jgi:hypothetical protein